MEASKKKSVIIIGVCLVTAAIITLVTNSPFGRNSGYGANRSLVLLCTNESCAKSSELPQGKYREMVKERGTNIAPIGGQNLFKCPECNEETVVIATKCGQCGAAFVPNPTVMNDYPDRCPDCGYSELEAMRDK